MTNGNSIPLTTSLLDQWATDPKGPVALHLKQRLLAVEGDDGEDQIIYPPTYAEIGYNVDTLLDGTRVALIDSVGSQANRLEPAFKSESGHAFVDLVPQIHIVLPTKGCGICDECTREKPKITKCKAPWREKRSLHDLAHRAADAVVQACPTLAPKVRDAFAELRKTGNAVPLCTIAPTSLVFGCWDSRGGSGEKRPRLVRAIIRAWDVKELHSAAQFNSISKALSDEDLGELKKEASSKKIELSEVGFADSPAVTYPGTKKRVLGGVVVHGQIQRDVTINLVALRNLNGGIQTTALRKYLLGLSILSATADIELFLREGCNLRYAEDNDQWNAVPRRGSNILVDLNSDASQKLLIEYAKAAYEPFQSAWKKLGIGNEHEFDMKAALKLIADTADKKKKKKSSEGNQ